MSTVDSLCDRIGADALMVCLPGALMTPRHMVDAGLFRAVRERGLNLDLLAINLHALGDSNHEALRILADEVVTPARAQYAQIWLTGISRGGQLTLSCLAERAVAVNGVCLLAPYPGGRMTINRIQKAGGLRVWEPSEDELQDSEFRLWRWLRSPDFNAPVFLGYGAEDRFVDGMQRLVQQLPRAQFVEVPGGHDWAAWLPLCSGFWTPGILRRCSGHEPGLDANSLPEGLFSAARCCRRGHGAGAQCLALGAGCRGRQPRGDDRGRPVAALQLARPNWVRLPAASSARRDVAITIDDGPDPQVTPAVLDLLDRAGVRASFFCIGRRARQAPALCREIVARGHAVENHGDAHSNVFSLFGPGRMHADVAAAQATLSDITGQTPRFFRATAGLRNPFLEPVLARLDLQLAAWTRRPYDTVQARPERVLQRLTHGLGAGDILLMHDGHAARTSGGEPVILCVLPRLLEQLKQADLTPVTLRESLR